MGELLTVSEQKRSLRTHARALRSSLSKEEKEALDRALCENVARHPLYREASVLLCFFPVRGEPDLLPLARLALREGKLVGFPISHSEDHTMTFRAVEDISELVKGAYGIPEPTEDGEILNHRKDALCLLPGLAFDSHGYRLGYGGGYYDRFLSDFQGKTLAPTYRMLVVDRLPIDKTDLPADCLITEKGEESIYVP